MGSFCLVQQYISYVDFFYFASVSTYPKVSRLSVPHSQHPWIGAGGSPVLDLVNSAAYVDDLVVPPSTCGSGGWLDPTLQPSLLPAMLHHEVLLDTYWNVR